MSPENLGNVLQSARQSKNVQLKTVASILKVKEKYLDAIEKGNISQITNTIYLQRCIKSYAQWLGLNAEVLRVDNLLGPIPKPPVLFWRSFPKVSSFYVMSMVLSIRIYMVSFLILCGIYGVWHMIQMRPVAEPLYDKQVHRMWIDDKLEAYEGKTFLLKAQQDIILKVQRDVSHTSETYALPKGRILRMVYHRGVVLEADHPQGLVIQLDDVQKTILGTLETVFHRVGDIS